MNAKLDPQFLRYDLFLNSVKLVDIAVILRLACSGYIGKIAYNPIDPAIKQHEMCVAMSFFSRIRQVQSFWMILWVKFSPWGGDFYYAKPIRFNTPRLASAVDSRIE